MKNYPFFQKLYFFAGVFIVLSFSFVKVSAQVINTDLKAIVFNEKIAIQVKDALSLSTYFSLGVGGKIEVSFYFGIDDTRNGIYTGTRYIQPNGKVNYSFAEIPFEMGDTLTFSVLESLPSGSGEITKEYVFIRGDFFPEGGGPITVCPISVTCTNHAIFLNFDPNEVIIGQGSATDIYLFLPGLYNNGKYFPTSYLDPGNALVIKGGVFKYVECEKIMSGQLTIIINGMTCVFQNGVLVSSNTCSPWANYYGDDAECGDYFEECTPELIQTLNSLKFELPCRQWIDYNFCNTTGQIKRPGRVAIGTSNFAPNIALSVKNGIITDKVKVTDTGWADYVFEKDYPLMPLEEVEAYIAKYHHLPGTPSGKEVEAAGSFELGETTVNHQVKIEEIFLHLIKLEEQTKILEAELFLYETLNKIRIKK
ncbi:MAG: hypothetical protein KA138_03185 [Saprospiraceae bacterium]|nr:hypothetical protein [Saprospiraceae bacterium]